MGERCANQCCPAIRRRGEGRLYRWDIELGSTMGSSDSKTEYLWLCDSCARVLSPKLEVTADSVQVRLVRKLPAVSVDAQSLQRSPLSRYIV